MDKGAKLTDGFNTCSTYTQSPAYQHSRVGVGYTCISDDDTSTEGWTDWQGLADKFVSRLSLGGVENMALSMASV